MASHHAARQSNPVAVVDRYSPTDLAIAGISLPPAQTVNPAGIAPATAEPDALTLISEDHPLWVAVDAAVSDGYGGVILSGPPGTGKSWYAQRIAARLAQDESRIRTVQFHPGYQYEDFIEGWESDGAGGFDRKPRHFLIVAEEASDHPELQYVVVIDEISRADVPRVFGEALTYLEMSLRGRPFHLASGRMVTIPSNVFVIATMNPWDISVDELDVALERRFAHIEVPPSEEELDSILNGNGVPAPVAATAKQLFKALQGSNNAMLHMGHAYFSRVTDHASLVRLWQFQIWPHIKRVTRLDPTDATRMEGVWNGLQARQQPAAPDAPAGAPGQAVGGSVTDEQR